MIVDDYVQKANSLIANLRYLYPTHKNAIKNIIKKQYIDANDEDVNDSVDKAIDIIFNPRKYGIYGKL